MRLVKSSISNLPRIVSSPSSSEVSLKPRIIGNPTVKQLTIDINDLTSDLEDDIKQRVIIESRSINLFSLDKDLKSRFDSLSESIKIETEKGLDKYLDLSVNHYLTRFLSLIDECTTDKFFSRQSVSDRLRSSKDELDSISQILKSESDKISLKINDLNAKLNDLKSISTKIKVEEELIRYLTLNHRLDSSLYDFTRLSSSVSLLILINTSDLTNLISLNQILSQVNPKYIELLVIAQSNKSKEILDYLIKESLISIKYDLRKVIK